MMNKRGEMKAGLGIGLLIMTAITVIVGLILMQGSATNVGQTSTTYTFEQDDGGNFNITIGAAGAIQDLVGQDLIGTATVVNASGDAVDCSANFTVSEGVSTTTGVKTIIGTTAPTGSVSWCAIMNVTYTYGPDGYINDAASRTVTTLILLFMALSIAVIALIPVTRDKLFDIIGRIR